MELAREENSQLALRLAEAESMLTAATRPQYAPSSALGESSEPHLLHFTPEEVEATRLQMTRDAAEVLFLKLQLEGALTPHGCTLDPAQLMHDMMAAEDEGDMPLDYEMEYLNSDVEAAGSGEKPDEERRPKSPS